MRLFALLLWILVPLGVYVTWQLHGTPHAIWNYTYRNMGYAPDGSRKRFYTSCTYVGWTGARKTPARGGRCPWIRFFTSRGAP